MDKTTKEAMAHILLPFFGAYGFSLASFFFMIIAFSVPYWMQSYNIPTTFGLVDKIGIWHVCFHNFIHYLDQNGRVWNGCFWILNRDFIDKGLWDWLNPWWITLVQVFITIAFIMQIFQAMVLTFHYMLIGTPLYESSTAVVLHLVAFICQVVCVSVFGYQHQLRWWMPRPDHMFLSWGFGCLMLSTICSLIALCYLYCVVKADYDSSNFLLPPIDEYSIPHAHSEAMIISPRSNIGFPPTFVFTRTDGGGTPLIVNSPPGSHLSDKPPPAGLAYTKFLNKDDYVLNDSSTINSSRI